jgi:transcription antitermination factor NusG
MLNFRDQPWYAIHVRSKHEQVVSSQLTGKGIASFLPTYRSKRVWSDRCTEIDQPLFSGYVFASFEDKHQIDVLKCAGVVKVVSFGRQVALVDPGELEQVQILARSNLLALPCPFLAEGEMVRLEEGPLKGIEGKIITIKNSFRLVVSVSLLQRGVSVEIDRGWVRPLRKTLLPANHDLASILAAHNAA